MTINICMALAQRNLHKQTFYSQILVLKIMILVNGLLCSVCLDKIYEKVKWIMWPVELQINGNQNRQSYVQSYLFLANSFIASRMTGTTVLSKY